MSSNSFLLQQILISSKRVAKVREMLELKKDEYVVSVRQGQIVIGNDKNRKTRTVEVLNGQSATLFLMGTVIPYAQREVVDHFKIPIKPLQHILMRRPRFRGYGLEVDGRVKTLKISFEEKLNSSQLRQLFKQITEWNARLSDEPSVYEKVKPIEFFDEKFDLMQKHAALKKQYRTHIPPEELAPLIKKTKSLLSPERAYTADDFRSMLSEFKKTLLV